MSKQFQILANQVKALRSVGTQLYEEPLISADKDTMLNNAIIDYLATQPVPVKTRAIADQIGSSYCATYHRLRRLAKIRLVASWQTSWAIRLPQIEECPVTLTIVEVKVPRWTTREAICARIRELRSQPLRTQPTNFALAYKPIPLQSNMKEAP